MKSYKEIAEAAGTTVEVVREVAKTVYRDVTGWHEAGNADGDVYGTKSEAIEAIAKRMKAEAAEASKDETGLSLETLAEALSDVNPGGVTVDDIITSYVHECVAARLDDSHTKAEADKAKAEREAIKADTEAAYKLMDKAGYDPHGDMDKVTAIVSSLETLADTKGVTVADLTVDDFHEAVDGGSFHALKDVCDAIDAHTPVRIYTTNCAIWDYIVGIEGDNIVHTEHFGAVQILDNAANVYPWDMNPTDRPMLCAGGATLTWTRGDLAHSWYESTCPNHKGEALTVEVDTIDGGDGHDGWLLTEWAKRGYIKHMASAWNTNVWVRTADGETTQRYNPQIKPSGEIEFSWIRERTEANRLSLLVEILKRFGKAE